MTDAKPASSPSPFAKIIRRETVFDGYHRLEVVQLQPKSLRHGGWAEEMEREIFFGNRISAALLYCPETDEVLLNRQFRVAPFLLGIDDPFMTECVAGAIDAGETPEQAARREAHEETGTHILDLVPAGRFFPSAGCLAEEMYLFIARVNDVTTGIFGEESEGEEIETFTLPADTAIAMLDSGEIVNGATVILLHWLARHKESLRRRWLQPEGEKA